MGTPVRRIYSQRSQKAVSSLGQQARRTDRGAPEPVDGAVGSPVRLVPAVLTFAEEQLSVDPLARQQSLDPYSDQPDPGPLEPERVVEPGHGGP